MGTKMLDQSELALAQAIRSELGCSDSEAVQLAIPQTFLNKEFEADLELGLVVWNSTTPQTSGANGITADDDPVTVPDNPNSEGVRVLVTAGRWENYIAYLESMYSSGNYHGHAYWKDERYGLRVNASQVTTNFDRTRPDEPAPKPRGGRTTQQGRSPNSTPTDEKFIGQRTKFATIWTYTPAPQEPHFDPEANVDHRYFQVKELISKTTRKRIPNLWKIYEGDAYLTKVEYIEKQPEKEPGVFTLREILKQVHNPDINADDDVMIEPSKLPKGLTTEQIDETLRRLYKGNLIGAISHPGDVGANKHTEQFSKWYGEQNHHNKMLGEVFDKSGFDGGDFDDYGNVVRDEPAPAEPAKLTKQQQKHQHSKGARS